MSKSKSKNKENMETSNFKIGDKVFWSGDTLKEEKHIMTVTTVYEDTEKIVCRFRNSKGDFETSEFNFDEVEFAD